MSYILQALKKAEQERELGQVPGIGSAQEQARAASGRRWWWLLLVALVGNAVVLAVVLWPASAPDQVAVSSVKSTASPAIIDTPVAPPPVTPSRPPVVAVAAAPPAETLQLPDRTPPSARLRPLPPLPEPAAVKKVETPVQPVLASAEPANNNLPVWPQVSSHLFQQINDGLHLDVHVYSDVPAERFVLINMKKYSEGEQLQEGPIVDEITPVDVVLSFRGQRFRVQSQ